MQQVYPRLRPLTAAEIMAEYLTFGLISAGVPRPQAAKLSNLDSCRDCAFAQSKAIAQPISQGEAVAADWHASNCPDCGGQQ